MFGVLLLERVACKYRYWGAVFSAVACTAQAAFGRLQGQLSASWDRLRQQFSSLHDGLRFTLERAMFQQLVPLAGPKFASSGAFGDCGAR